LAIGIGLGDSFKLGLGYRFDPYYYGGNSADAGNDPTASKSAINASLLFSGSPVDALTFDLFYAIKGQDNNSFARPTYPSYDTWGNILGAYVGINGIDNIGLSFGFTFNFDVAETAAWDAKGEDAVTATLPAYSGVDIRFSFSGIDKIGLTFNNNVSFAGVTGKGDGKVPDSKRKEVVVGVLGNELFNGQTDSWFHWNTELKFSFAFIEDVGLTLHLANQLGVKSYAHTTAYIDNSTAKGTYTDNEFRVSFMAQTGAGSFTIASGLFFSLASKAIDYESKFETTVGGTNTSRTSTLKGNVDTITFGIPIMVQVQF